MAGAQNRQVRGADPASRPLSDPARNRVSPRVQKNYRR